MKNEVLIEVIDLEKTDQAIKSTIGASLVAQW